MPALLFILKTAVSPQKARKTRKKSECCVDLAIHPLGDSLGFGISLKIFVLFVFFVDEMIFLGLWNCESSQERARNNLSIISPHPGPLPKGEGVRW